MYKDYYNYTIYDDGRIYTHYRNKFLTPDITKFGYEQVVLQINKQRKVIRVHQLVALLFVPNPDPQHLIIVNHKDGNKRNNNYQNLEWCTYYFNNKHARDTGLNNISEANRRRWSDPEFREKTSSHFSEIHRGKGIGMQNPNAKYKVLLGNQVLNRREVAKLLGTKSLGPADVRIRKAAHREDVPEFKKLGISVVNIKES